MILANWEIKTTNRPILKFADRTERCEIRVGFLGPACRLTNQDGHIESLRVEMVKPDEIPALWEETLSDAG